MDRGALDHALEGGGGHGFRPFNIGHKGRQIIVNEILKRLAQIIEADRTGAHDSRGFRLVDQRQKKMLQCRQFVTARIGERERRVDCLFKRSENDGTCVPLPGGARTPGPEPPWPHTFKAWWNSGSFKGKRYICMRGVLVLQNVIVS